MFNLILNKKTKKVSGKSLCESLGIKSPLHKWIKRIANEYGFVENIDYKRVVTKSPTLGGEQNTVDYILTWDTAKEIAMVSKTPIGKQIRHYLIELEKQATNEQKAIAFDLMLDRQKQRNLQLEFNEFKPSKYEHIQANRKANEIVASIGNNEYRIKDEMDLLDKKLRTTIYEMIVEREMEKSLTDEQKGNMDVVDYEH